MATAERRTTTTSTIARRAVNRRATAMDRAPPLFQRGVNETTGRPSCVRTPPRPSSAARVVSTRPEGPARSPHIPTTERPCALDSPTTIIPRARGRRSSSLPLVLPLDVGVGVVVLRFLSPSHAPFRRWMPERSLSLLGSSSPLVLGVVRDDVELLPRDARLKQPVRVAHHGVAQRGVEPLHAAERVPGDAAPHGGGAGAAAATAHTHTHVARER